MTCLNSLNRKKIVLKGLSFIVYVCKSLSSIKYVSLSLYLSIYLSSLVCHYYFYQSIYQSFPPSVCFFFFLSVCLFLPVLKRNTEKLFLWPTAPFFANVQRKLSVSRQSDSKNKMNCRNHELIIAITLNQLFKTW